MLEAVRHDELLRVLLFVLVAASVFIAAAVILYRRWRRATPLTRIQTAVVSCAGLGLLCVLYGAFIEPRWPEVTHTRVATVRLPAGHHGVRIVHLSDIHSEPRPVLETVLPERVAALEPDVIVFTGDAANAAEAMPVFRAALTAFAKIAPTFVVKGNWETTGVVRGDRFGGTGATLLEGASASIDVAGTRVHILGAGYGGNTSGLNAALAALPPEGPAVVLFHLPYPDIVRSELASRVDLMCAGHTHGGQVALPFYGALLTLSKHGRRFDRGFFPDADGFGFPLYVNRGIGMGRPGPRVRFSSRPEIAVIELVPAQG